MDELAEALENKTRRLFGGLTLAELTAPHAPDGRPRPLLLRKRRRSRFEARLRAELLGERSALPDEESGFGPRLRGGVPRRALGRRRGRVIRARASKRDSVSGFASSRAAKKWRNELACTQSREHPTSGVRWDRVTVRHRSPPSADYRIGRYFFVSMLPRILSLLLRIRS